MDATLPYYVKVTFSNVAGLVNSDAGYDTAQSIVICEKMFSPDGDRVLEIPGIPAGTEYTVAEIKTETVDGKVYTSGLNGEDFKLLDIKKTGENTAGDSGYDPDTQTYSGVIVADEKDANGTPIPTHNNIIITNDINPVTDGDDLSGEKRWEVGDKQVIFPSDIPKPDSVSIKLQKRLKVRDTSTDTTEEFEFSDVNVDETDSGLKTPVSLQIKGKASTQEVQWKTANGITYKITLDNQGDWKFAIKGLPKYGKSSKGYRREYEYRIIETAMNYKDNLYAGTEESKIIGVVYENEAYKETTTGFTPSGGSYDLTNTYNPLTTLEITKVSGKEKDETDNNKPKPLKGVTFLLQRIKPGTTDEIDKTFNNNTESINAETNEQGNCNFAGLPDGTYRLTEIKTAAGHSLLSKAIDIVISQGGVCTADGNQVYITGKDKNTLALTINNQGVTDLPMTGSRLRWVVIGLGILLVALGEGCYLWNMYHPEAKGAFRKVKTAEGFTFDLGFDEELKGEEHSTKNSGFKYNGFKTGNTRTSTRTKKVSHKEYGKPMPPKNKSKNRQTENNSQKKKRTGNQGIPPAMRNSTKPVSPRVNPKRIPDATNKTGETIEKTKTKEKNDKDVII